MYQSLCTLPALHSAWKSVKAKNSAGGIDGFSVLDFEAKLETNLKQLSQDLKAGKWNPEPYLRIEIPKNETEKRRLGMLSIKDKIVQQAIKTLVEPKFERIFLGNSYGYRPGKGHTKAVRRTAGEMGRLKNGWVAQLDIDDYFDTIDHTLLFARLESIVRNPEILRLMELSVKTGVVSKRLKWTEVKAGVPQGAVLSPLLANFYLHPFDQFVTGKTSAYVRYADDFVMIAENREQINQLAFQASEFLQKRLLLKLNDPIICPVASGIEFLGVVITNGKIAISDQKKAKLLERIQALDIQKGAFNPKAVDGLVGIKRYYASLLPQEQLVPLDMALNDRISTLIHEHFTTIPSRERLQAMLKEIPSFSNEAELFRNRQIKIWQELYAEKKKLNKSKTDQKNIRLINQKKREYQKQEGAGAELVISSYGSFIGKTNKGISVKVNGRNLSNAPKRALAHISVISNGVSISSDAVYYCMNNKIPVDFFDRTGQLYASILSPISVEHALWQKQAQMEISHKLYLASQIVAGKLKNQLNLAKYFHKYHKSHQYHQTDTTLSVKYEELSQCIDQLLQKIKNIDNNEKYAEMLMSYEAMGATAYWAYVRQLIHDDGIAFDARVRKGADDLFNSLLNYGYAFLYSRVWQALLQAKLNPSMGVLHAYQAGKPTLAFDLIELFRAQAVDRVVIGLVQKGEPLSMEKTLLHDDTKKLLTKNILERINRYEKYRGQEMKFVQIISNQAKELADYISGASRSFKPYIAKW